MAVQTEDANPRRGAKPHLCRATDLPAPLRPEPVALSQTFSKLSLPVAKNIPGVNFSQKKRGQGPLITSQSTR